MTIINVNDMYINEQTFLCMYFISVRARSIENFNFFFFSFLAQYIHQLSTAAAAAEEEEEEAAAAVIISFRYT
ncbi:hypothetical protein DERF_005202 [Dermatophagoides farinae]|uniref:Uncharacterized protein n=1 Tax=Dermatophagoides farinae TaxID=6954 RepID=A0A922L6X5_DERFA|nr:hypothetical protein DERF_005202 [Dermatophagoides farinae]